MTIQKQSLVLDNGGSIWLPPNPNLVNLSIPDLSKPDTSQLYDIGTAYLYNGKCYYYSYSTAIVKSRQLAETSYHQATAQAVIAANADIYATEIVITTASGDGIASDGVFAKDALKGGHVVVFVAGSGGDDDDFTAGIISSSAVVAAGEMTIKLDTPIPHALVHDTSVAEAIASPYAYIRLGADVARTKVGVPTCYAAAARWVWVQTWGPTWVAPQSTVGVAGLVGIVARHDGSLEPADSTVSSLISNQHLGYTMFPTSTSTQAAPFVYLQIAHP
uniref:Uncharacterized protein n=1 Tax=viral metagenome TaxID=1070528 RepID=A0A6M3J548_9ZZZZ